ncbi:MAG: hypothetical protein IJ736_06110 [Firmicutes bacterium]|nr:hypothetical protein [Bacillota bacterium]
MMNPIIKKEITVLFRSKKIFAIIGIYGFIMTSFIALIVLSMVGVAGSNMRELAQVYYFVFAFQLMMIYIIVPTVTAGRISGERERQTLDMLLMTKMSDRSIIKGMLYGSLIITAIIISVTLPIYGVMFYYEIVSLAELVVSLIYMISNIIFVASISIFFSAMMKRSVTATLATYFILLGYSLISIIMLEIIGVTVEDMAYDIIYPYNGSVNNNEVYFIPYDVIFSALWLGNPIFGFMSVVDAIENKEIIADILDDMIITDIIRDIFTGEWVRFSFILVVLEQIFMSSFFVRMAALRLKKIGKRR